MNLKFTTLSLGAFAAAGTLSWLAVPLLRAEPLPTPTAKPLPTRRPTPRPEVTPAPLKKLDTAAAGLPLKIEGVVAGTPGKVDFFLRTDGMTYRVVPWDPDLLGQIRGGDGVRVYGWADGLMITKANVRTIKSRASNSPSDYGDRSMYNLMKTNGGKPKPRS